VLRRSRRLGGSIAAAGRPLAPLGIGHLAEGLRGRTFIELVDVGGTLGAFVVRGAEGARRARARLVTLGPMADAASEVTSLRFALGRALTPGARRASVEASTAGADAAATRLDELLLGQIRGELPPEGVVIIPTGALHGVPWAVLPTLAGLPVSVAPSARSWLATTTGPGPRATVGLVGGPGIPELEEELSAVADAHGGSSTVVVRQGATATEALELLGAADVVHGAAHGRFRGDSPMFSSLTFADGPLTVHDLAGLRSAPSLVVLSACEVGRSEVRPGDEVQGVVSVLLGLGTTTLVASVLPVPHQLACDVTVGFHRGLVRGLAPAEALASAVPAGVRSPFIVFGGG
jgi:hypothetical protein